MASGTTLSCLTLRMLLGGKRKRRSPFSFPFSCMPCREINYRASRCIVRINGLDSELWKEDNPVCTVAGGRWYPHSENRDCRGCETEKKAVEEARKRIWNRAEGKF